MTTALLLASCSKSDEVTLVAAPSTTGPSTTAPATTSTPAPTSAAPSSAPPTLDPATLISFESIGGIAVGDVPVAAKRHTFEYLREVAHLRTRTNTFGAIARVRNCLAQAVHRYFHERGFLWVHTPIVTASDCEGAGEMFRVSTLDLLNLPRDEQGGVDFGEDFFGKEAFLTVSGQLNVETYCCSLGNVYTFGPTFRAENSNTSRHLAEFWMIEPEIVLRVSSKVTMQIVAEDILEVHLQARCSKSVPGRYGVLQSSESTRTVHREHLEHVSSIPLSNAWTYTEADRRIAARSRAGEDL